MVVDEHELLVRSLDRDPGDRETPVKLEVFFGEAFVNRIGHADSVGDLVSAQRKHSRLNAAVGLGKRVQQINRMEVAGKHAAVTRERVDKALLHVDVIASCRVFVDLLKKGEVGIKLLKILDVSVQIRFDDILACRPGACSPGLCSVLHLAGIHKEAVFFIICAEAGVPGYRRIIRSGLYALRLIVRHVQRRIVFDPVIICGYIYDIAAGAREKDQHDYQDREPDLFRGFHRGFFRYS